jgi:hypothetical protein
MIDEDYLRTQGITNFDKYRLNKNHEPPRMMPKVLLNLCQKFYLNDIFNKKKIIIYNSSRYFLHLK